MSVEVALLVVESLLAFATPWFASKSAQAILGAWFAAIAAQALVAYCNRVRMGRLASRVWADLSLRVYEHLQALPLGWHQQRRRGEVLALLIRDVWRVTSHPFDSKRGQADLRHPQPQRESGRPENFRRAQTGER